MAGEYKTDAQTNLNWVQSWSMTVGAPAIAKRIFDTKAHALLFINGDSQNNIDADPSAIAGLVLRVVLDTAENNGIYSVVYVNPSQPSQGLALMRMIDEQRKVTVSSGTTSLAIEANTLYQFASTYKPTALTISSIPDSNLEAEIMFEADGTSGCTITMGSGIEYIGNLNIPAGAKAYINIKNNVVAIYNSSMVQVDAQFYEQSQNMATSEAIATWVHDVVDTAIAAVSQSYKANWMSEPTSDTGITNRPNPLWTTSDPVPVDVEDPSSYVILYKPEQGKENGCLHGNGKFIEVRELPTTVNLIPSSGSITVSFAANTIYKVADNAGDVDSVTINADAVNNGDNTAETILYFKTGSEGGTITVTGNNKPIILGPYDEQTGGTLVGNTRYVVNYKDGIMIISPTEHFVTVVKREITSGTYQNVSVDGEARIPLFKPTSEGSDSGLVPAASKAKQVLTGNGWGNLFVSSRTGSDVMAGVFYWDNPNLYICVDVTGTTATWVQLNSGSSTIDTTTIS